MEDVVVCKTEEGSPQGGLLSPLLANICLNEFDQEMERRGVKLVRYADDIVLLARSKRAAERLLESGRRYLEGKRKLKMNREKSRVTSVFAWKKFKFLGFSLGKNGTGIFIQAHKSALRKAKAKLKSLTKRNRGCNVRKVMQEVEVKVFIRGWLGYYYMADMKQILRDWNAWLRRRFRMYIWKQWKKPRTKVANLRKLGIPDDKAYQWGNSRLGCWRIAGSLILKCSITNEKLEQAGYLTSQPITSSFVKCTHAVEPPCTSMQTGRDKDEVAGWMDATSWWTGPQVKENGFVDELTDNGEGAVVENRSGVLFVNSVSMNLPFAEVPKFVQDSLAGKPAGGLANTKPAGQPEHIKEVQDMEIKTVDDLRKAYLPERRAVIR